MVKKLTRGVVAMATTVVATVAAEAQTPDAATLKPTEITQQEIIGVLEAMGAHALRFDTGEMADGRYRFVPYCDQYADGRKVEDENALRMAMTQDWRPKPTDKEVWNKITELYEPKTSADGTKFLRPLDGVGVTVVKRSDSTVVARVEVYGLGAIGMPLKLRPLQNGGKTPSYSYGYKPFRIVASGERKQRIPLMLVGSFWWDEKVKVHRFCTVREFAPDLSDYDLKYIPHYYVIGVEIERIE